MGTTASTAQQTVSASAPFEGLQDGGSMDGRHSLSVHSFQTTGLHNSKAKSIIPNKVAPVVITYNCKEEFQIHDELLKAHYTLGRLSDATPEHYLIQGRCFLVRDVTEKTDMLGTLQSCGAPNFRQVRGGLAVFGMGQPSLSGFRQVLQKLQKDGHRECVIFCVREEPVLFLRAAEDFVSYTPRDKQNLHENLQGLGPGVPAERLELAIRKEIHDFAQLSENKYYVYHNTEDLWGEPHAVAIRGEDDVHVTEEVFKRPLFLQPSYRYHRLPLPEQGAPLEAQFDAFVGVLRETPSLLLLQDAHGPPPALLFSCQTGVGRASLGMVLGTLLLFRRGGAALRPEAAPVKTKPLSMEQLEVVQNFLHTVPEGRRMVEEVDRAIAACAELHDLKEVVLGNQRELEGSRAQGSSSQHGVQQRALQSLERYFYLILFNYYLHEQYPLAFALSFSRWLCVHPDAEEADLIQADRMIEEEEVVRPRRRKKEENGAVQELAKVLLAMRLDNYGPRTAARQEQAAGEWETQRSQKKRMKKKVKVELRKLNTMTEAEANEIQDVWQLDLNSRWQLYRLWLQMYQADTRRKILNYERQYRTSAERMAELRLQEDLHILKDAQVVGMTTTGAAKYRQILQKVEPRIVIVEEAAEVLEAHTIATLSKACQHLILIGDHQQLRPSANVYDLAKNFNLEVSLFERLVKVNIPFVRLNYQHRMRPEIARLLTPHIYQDLENHPSVLKYEKIKGVSSNLFFVEHTFPEQEIQEGKSHQNQHEARFVVELCKYFLCQEYLPSQITILTTYTGQLFCLRKLMPAKTFAGVRVHVVDKYQGEENDIILLSLVRSNPEGKVGFLQISNRICVALSRAKKGMYCIGNMQMLAKVPLWSKIIHTLRENNQIGSALRLCCQNHPDTHTLVSKASDFQKVPEGGCSLPCEFRLGCGHVCTRACHPYDSSHKEFQCMKPCQKVICQDGHRCPLVCSQECQPCQVKMPKTILRCGHKQMVPCSVPESDFCCQEPCPKVLKCGHRCSHTCGEDCVRLCSEMVTVKLKCGHRQQVKCGSVEDLKYGLPVKCTTECGSILDCGHPCPGSCHSCFEGRFHERCQQPCKRLLICSHKCQEPCTGECPPCQRTCQNRCVHSECKKKCGELCTPCVEPCTWRCRHYQCTRLCCEPCNRPPCYVPCTKLLACGHPCIGLCGEPCPKKCRVCHQEEVTQIFFGSEDEPDARFVQLEDCSHIFEVQALDRYMNEQGDEVAIKLKVCPICQVPIRKNLRYGTSLKQCLEEIEVVKEKILGSAGEIAVNQKRLTDVLEGKNLLCQLLPEDFLKLKEKLAQKNLSVKDLGLVENYINFYDHLAGLYDSLKKVDVSEQNKVRTRLDQVHEWLAKKRLSFSSQELDDLQSEIQRLRYLVTLLTRCKMAEGKVRGSVAEEVSTVRNILERTCKFTQQDAQLVQRKMEALKATLPCSGLGISEEERVQIVTAMGYPRGHWFKCPNGHIYAIGDCGGAMQRATCPECREVIGGQNHTLERSNRLASEMDGAQHPAWSDTANNLMNYEEIRRMM